MTEEDKLIIGLRKVLRDDEGAFDRWMNAKFVKFKGKTPRELIAEGRIAEVQAVVDSYIDPGQNSFT